MGGKIQDCHDIAKLIWTWAECINIWLVASHIAGKLNTSADQLSRLLNETTEWKIKKRYFQEILSRFPNINIDLFASHFNNQLSRYVSWLPDKNAEYCDAFTLDWCSFFGYAFPPFNLIGRVLKKVELDECSIILVVPDWPSQYWYSKLMSMLCCKPLFLPRGSVSLENPLKPSATPIAARFIVCKISGSTTHLTV